MVKNRVTQDKGQTFSVTKSYLWKPINIENYTYPVIQDSFKALLKIIPHYSFPFRPGLVIGQQFAYNIVRAKGNKINYLLLDFEESGAVLGFFKSLDKGPLLRYVRAQIEFRHTIDYGKNQMAFRAYAGAGYAYGLTESVMNIHFRLLKHFIPVAPTACVHGRYEIWVWDPQNIIVAKFTEQL